MNTPKCSKANDLQDRKFTTHIFAEVNIIFRICMFGVTDWSSVQYIDIVTTQFISHDSKLVIFVGLYNDYKSRVGSNYKIIR